jgi:hypothetical protein
VPWYRYCQMERSSRWAFSSAPRGKPWDNSQADGPWVDVATAHTYAALLSADPLPPPTSKSVSPPPPKQLLMVDVHDDLHPELDSKPVLEHSLNSAGRWANPVVPYDPVTGTGTFFASALRHFLASLYEPRHLGGVPRDMSFIVFPDEGAYKRFHRMVSAALPGLADDHVLFIEKTRVGTQVQHAETLYYIDRASGARCTNNSLPSGCHALIVDDFTNSGSTLFGGAKVLNAHTPRSEVTVTAFVSHFVAKYDRAVVGSFATKLYANDSPLDAFYCSDSIPCTCQVRALRARVRWHCPPTHLCASPRDGACVHAWWGARGSSRAARASQWLHEECEKRAANGAEPRAHVIGLAPVIAAWLRRTKMGDQEVRA